MADANGGELSPQTEDREEVVQEAPKREPVSVTISDIELEGLRNEVEEFKDKYYRVLAESENTRKRLQKERVEMIQYAIENIVCDFLAPIDQLENALAHANNASDDVKQWSIGFQMILARFKELLTSNNVISFESVGKPFDPHLHEAIEMVASTEYAPGTVVEEHIKGYKMGDRVIRHARVKVSRAPSEG